MTGDGGLVEVQATAERTPLSRAHLDELLALAEGGIGELRAVQERALETALRAQPPRPPPRRGEARPRDAQRAQGAGVRRAARAARGRAAARRRDAAARGRRDLRRQRAGQGARGRGGARRPGRSPTTPGSRPTRSAARRACARRGSRARTPTTRRTWPGSCARRRPAARLTYVCAIAFVDPGDGVERVFEGRCTGTRAAEPRGTGGFGYDPAFVPDDLPGGRTMAEVAPDEKAAIGHRGRAARALLAELR